ncbi:MAG: hypothetical protein JWM00_96 [Candidatus Saccharibacteria bacterium]|nr:hypothetical protein [Candidatus Saccharibacteria bacterium]
MIENRELAYVMASAEAPHRELAIRARALGSDAIVAIALHDAVLASKKAGDEYLAELSDQILLVSVNETMQLNSEHRIEVATKGDFTKTADVLGYPRKHAITSWNVLARSTLSGTLPLAYENLSFDVKSHFDQATLDIESLRNFIVEFDRMIISEGEKHAFESIGARGFGPKTFRFLKDFATMHGTTPSNEA